MYRSGVIMLRFSGSVRNWLFVLLLLASVGVHGQGLGLEPQFWFDIVPHGEIGNRINDHNRHVTISGIGTKFDVEVFVTGISQISLRNISLNLGPNINQPPSFDNFIHLKGVHSIPFSPDVHGHPPGTYSVSQNGSHTGASFLSSNGDGPYGILDAVGYVGCMAFETVTDVDKYRVRIA